MRKVSKKKQSTTEQTALILGGAGFIGTNLARRLLAAGQRVIIIDNLSRGSLKYIAEVRSSGRLSFIQADLADSTESTKVFRNIAENCNVAAVWHLAANSDILAGVKDIRIDVRDTFMTTINALYSMEKLGMSRLFFASTSAVYGDKQGDKVAENVGDLEPISNYGAMKLASEAAISAAAEKFLRNAIIFRFPNVVGCPATHGVIYDFVKRLQKNPNKLDVLGDGNQRKIYLHVEDLVEAMMFCTKKCAKLQRVTLNIGPADSGITVREIAKLVVDEISPKATVYFGTEPRGWIGDVPKFRYCTKRLSALGWEKRLSSMQAVQRAVREIVREARF